MTAAPEWLTPCAPPTPGYKAGFPTGSPMTHPPAPKLTIEAEAARVERQAREAEALRANLRRRKEQARARAEPPAPKDQP